MKKEASAAPAEEKPRRVFRLKLDHDDVYFGCEELPAEDLHEVRATLGEVLLDHAPDNPAGRYRWSREHGKFEPLPKAQQKTEPGAPTLEQAFYAFVKFGAESPRAKAWCEWFEKTFDAKFTGPGA